MVGGTRCELMRAVGQGRQYPHIAGADRVRQGGCLPVAAIDLELDRAHTRQEVRCRDLHRLRRAQMRSEEHTSELQSQSNLVCRLLLEKKKNKHLERCLTRSVLRLR